jgi:hypothetical protein
MNRRREEGPITERVVERPAFSPHKVLRVKPRALLVRFVSGALTSIVSGAVSLAFGARVGGVLLAFPAIMAASLTLIEQQEDSAEAREDARGAVVGGCGLTAFAVVAALTLGHLAWGLALVAAAGAWALVALGVYLVAWWR